MSSWLREVNILALASTLLITIAWAAGGWMMVTGLFNIHPRGRMVGGLAVGLLLYQEGVNLTTRFLGLPWASGITGIAILAAGIGCLASSPSGWKKWREGLEAWPQLVWLAGLTYLFFLLGRGTSLFDDYEHLPMISVMATGDIPPHFYLNPTQYFAYHYGLQVWSASLVRLAGAYPWIAWDFAKAFAIGLTLLVGWLWLRRITRSLTAANLGAFLFVFAGGARWLLLLLPVSLLAWIQRGVSLTNTGTASGANLIQALASPWVAEGAGKMPFPFAFHSGFFLPVEFYLGATGAIPFATVLLLLLLGVPRGRNIAATIILGLIMANLALNAEHLMVFLFTAIAVVLIAYLVSCWRKRTPIDRWMVINWLIILFVGGLLSLAQGGFITEAARGFLAGLGSNLVNSNNVYNFSFRWPPLLASGHLGNLSPINPRQLIPLLAELGPAVLFIPLVSRWSWRSARRGHWLEAGFGFAALASMVFALFFQYGLDRSSTRLPGTALWLWVVLAFPLLWWLSHQSSKWMRGALMLCFGALVLEGIVTFAIQMTTAVQPQAAYFIDNVDLAFSQAFWNRLEAHAQVLDHIQYRSVTVFGRPATANLSIFETMPAWDALIKSPDPAKVAAAGYTYIYMDDPWWKSLSSQTQQLFEQPCVKVTSEKHDPANPRQDYRILWDVRSCHP